MPQEPKLEKPISMSTSPHNITHKDEDFLIHPKQLTDPPNIVHVKHQTSNNLFEFLSDQSCEMSHAEDIFLCGKLLPLQQQQPQSHAKSHADDNMLKAFHQRRCESLSEQTTSDRLCTSPRRLRRNSRSLNYLRKNRDYSSLYETSPNNTDIVRGLSQNRSPSNVDELKVSKPRWYLMLFGLLAKIPHQEMDLQDIKIRQSRRKNNGLCEAIQNETNKSSWGMLNVLSCKSNASIAVASSGRQILG